MTELEYWLALSRAPDVGAVTISTLLERYGTPHHVFEASAGELRGLVSDAALAYLRDPDWAAIAPDLDWLAEPDNHLLTLTDPHYPPLIKETVGPPPILYIKGDPAQLSRPQLGMVGSRNPSPGGGDTAFEFARHLAGAGLTITSGLALGIDAAAHRGALEAGGTTIAVAGTGLDRVYPARHRELAHQIAEQGALISEFPIGTPPLPAHFPRRNRIISGLSLGVLVVEAALRSGSLITARIAGEQGREVFAIPGSIHNPLARGCHQLIRQGAKLVETAEHIVEELGPLAAVTLSTAETADAPAPNTLDADYHSLLACLGHDPTPVDTLVQRSGLTPEAISSMLLVLELQGFVASTTGGLYSRTAERS